MGGSKYPGTWGCFIYGKETHFILKIYKIKYTKIVLVSTFGYKGWESLAIIFTSLTHGNTASGPIVYWNGYFLFFVYWFFEREKGRET